MADEQPLTAREREIAYALALLSAELLGRVKTDYLYDYLAALGISVGDAATIARAFALATGRAAQWVETHSGARE